MRTVRFPPGALGLRPRSLIRHLLFTLRPQNHGGAVRCASQVAVDDVVAQLARPQEFLRFSRVVRLRLFQPAAKGTRWNRGVLKSFPRKLLLGAHQPPEHTSRLRRARFFTTAQHQATKQQNPIRTERR